MKKTKKSEKISKAVNAVISEYRKGSPEADPLGMYTGITEPQATAAIPASRAVNTPPSSIPDEQRPTQDADDL